MDCQWFEENISRYFEGEMSADEQRAFKAHAMKCEQCMCLYRQFPPMMSELNSLPQVKLPYSFALQFVQQQRGEPKRVSAAQPQHANAQPAQKRRSPMRAITSMAAAVVILICGFFLYRNMIQNRNLPQQDNQPSQQVAQQPQGGDAFNSVQMTDGDGQPVEESGGTLTVGEPKSPAQEPAQDPNLVGQEPQGDDAPAAPYDGDSQEPNQQEPVSGGLVQKGMEPVLFVPDVNEAAAQVGLYLEERQISFTTELTNGVTVVMVTLPAAYLTEFQEYALTLGTLDGGKLCSDEPMTLILAQQAVPAE